MENKTSTTLKDYYKELELTKKISIFEQRDAKRDEINGKILGYKKARQEELDNLRKLLELMPEIKSRAKAYCGTMTNGNIKPTPKQYLEILIEDRIKQIEEELKLNSNFKWRLKNETRFKQTKF